MKIEKEKDNEKGNRKESESETLPKETIYIQQPCAIRRPVMCRKLCLENQKRVYGGNHCKKWKISMIIYYHCVEKIICLQVPNINKHEKRPVRLDFHFNLF